MTVTYLPPMNVTIDVLFMDIPRCAQHAQVVEIFPQLLKGVPDIVKALLIDLVLLSSFGSGQRGMNFPTRRSQLERDHRITICELVGDGGSACHCIAGERG
jgi:hypothetical protein